MQQRRILIGLAAASVIATLYFGWALYRTGKYFLFVPPEQRQALPYYPVPDRWLNHMHDYIDRARPLPPGADWKHHGEVRAVRQVLFVLTMGFACTTATLLPWAWSSRRAA